VLIARAAFRLERGHTDRQTHTHKDTTDQSIPRLSAIEFDSVSMLKKESYDQWRSVATSIAVDPLVSPLSRFRRYIEWKQNDRPTDGRNAIPVRLLYLSATKETRSHPETVGDMSRVTLNFDQSKIPFVHF